MVNVTNIMQRKYGVEQIRFRQDKFKMGSKWVKNGFKRTTPIPLDK